MAGPTASERYLARLCRHSFLRLWSWPNVYRDQHWSKGHVGKEVCDLLVVFDRHVFIFSDKYCDFPNTGRLDVDWGRWFKKAILKSANQVWGAERWLKQFPDRLFLDEKCQHRFPLVLPPMDKAILHRIVVAHGSGPRCRSLHGGSGSLMLLPRIVGGAHWDSSRPGFLPFAIGRLSEGDGYVHVIDDFTLDVLMTTLDTVQDLAMYLEKKTELIESGRLLGATGEEDLLAYYLQYSDRSGKHYFHLPPDKDGILLAEGIWERFKTHPDRLAQVRANSVSYAWDKIIDKFTKHMLDGTQYYSTHKPISEQEISFRFLAREHRTRRRMLAKALLGIIKQGDKHDRAVRVLLPSGPDEPHYVFLSLIQPPDRSYEEYRVARRNLLEAYCLVTRLKFPDARHVVGLATEPFSYGDRRSEDLMYFDAAGWNEDLASEAREVQQSLGLLENLKKRATTESEYPRRAEQLMRKGRYRNSACTCGSGLKFKKCCGFTTPNS